ncbi:MAG: SUMF1/EgtB/PvdO family nonheme iron enzyme [Chloroflexota bacterium]
MSPQQLEQYQIEVLLGEGTFAKVYRAFDQKLERAVALKILKPIWLEDQEAVGRFKAEAKTMARLRHPHIVDVYDVGEAQGQLYLAQLLVEGETLADRITRGPLSWEETLALSQDVAQALDYAHEQGVIHRDVKPSNILLDKSGRAYLGDFGLMRAAEGSTVLSSSSGGMIGTPAYMAPEQWQGQSPSPATDIYALSCVITEILTGRPLFDAPTPPAVMTQHMLDGPQFPDPWPAGTPTGVSQVLQQGLAPEMSNRLSQASDLVTALKGLGYPTTARPSHADAPPSNRGMAWLWPVAILLLVLVLAGGILSYALYTLWPNDQTISTVSVAQITPSLTPVAEPTSTEPLLMPLPTHSPTPTLSLVPLPTNTLTPQPTSTNTPTPTHTPFPQVTSNEPVNLRAGPGTNYPVTGQLLPDTPLLITGRNADSSWWQVEQPSGDLNWVADSVVVTQNTDSISLAQIPATPILATPTPSVPDGMVLIPAGAFIMGGDNGDNNEKPVHTLTLDDFFIDIYEVTNAQFIIFLNDDVNQTGHIDVDSKNAHIRSLINVLDPDIHIYQNSDMWQVDQNYANHPVTEVSWHGAKNYCEWRGGRLPTEAEWEKAARGTDGRTYPWGDEFDGNRLNFCDTNCEHKWADEVYDDGYAGAAPVGSYPNGVSPYGVYDMAGNVWEWVSSEYRDYPYNADDGREDLSSTNDRVHRGGSWYDQDSYARGINRRGGGSTSRHRYLYPVGFRCASG